MSDKLTVEINGEPRKLFMSYGLLTTLVDELTSKLKIDATDIYIRPHAQRRILELILRPRDDEGDEAGAFSIDDIDLPIETAREILAWAVEHIQDFFVTSLELTKASIKRFEEKLGDNLALLAPEGSDLTSSPAGIES